MVGLPPVSTCSYKECGKTSRKNPGLRKFSFPTKDPDRCNMWMLRSGYYHDLSKLSDVELQKRFICCDHFKPEDFMAKKLHAGVVPVAFVEPLPGFETPVRTYEQTGEAEPSPLSTATSSSEKTVQFLTPAKESQHPARDPASDPKPGTSRQFMEEVINLPSPPASTPASARRKLSLSSEETPRKKRLRAELQVTRKKLKMTKAELKTQIRRNLSLSAPRDLRNLRDFPKALTKMQLYHKARKPFAYDEKKAALSLYYKSPSAYRFLRDKGTILPSVSVIRSWLSDFKSKPGLNRKLFKKLQLKSETMSSAQKTCMLLFDEMAIKQAIEFSKQQDLIEGFEDLGELGRRAVPAKQALVIMARGVYSDWKLPLSFYFSNTGMRADNLEIVIKSHISALLNAGFNVIGIVCDQGTTNQKLFKSLKISSETQSFIHENRQIYGLFDVPHLIKSVRNNLLTGRFVSDDSPGEYVSFEVVRKLYRIDQMSTAKCLTKLTPKHLNPNAFQKMSVRLAAQVMSHSVAAGIKTAVNTKQLSQDCLPTAKFIEMMDNAFDALNSKTLYSKKPCNQALSDQNQDVLKALDNCVNVMQSLHKVDFKNKKSRPPCFDGIILSINSVRNIFEDSKCQDFKFLLTGRLNQDPLENFFSVIRQKGGYNKNPTVRTFQGIFKLNCVIHLMRSPSSSNCEEDQDFNIFVQHENVPEMILEEPDDDEGEELASALSSSESPNSSSNEEGDEQPTLEDCSTTYFAGYLGKKATEKFNCVHCQTSLLTEQNLDNSDELLIFFKNYSEENPCQLNTPSELLKQFTKIAMNVMGKKLKTEWAETDIVKKIKNRILGRISSKLNEWDSTASGECKNHRDFMLELLIRVLIYKECKMYAGHATQKTAKKNTKLSILQHE